MAISYDAQALLAELGEERGMASMVSSIPYLRDCVDDLNSTSRLMRKWLEESTQIVYGPGCYVEVEFLRDSFIAWKQARGIRPNQSSGESSILSSSYSYKMDFADDRLALDASILAGVITLTLHAGRMFVKPPPRGGNACPLVSLHRKLKDND